MQRTMLKSKIHRATVTNCDLHYVLTPTSLTPTSGQLAGGPAAQRS